MHANSANPSNILVIGAGPVGLAAAAQLVGRGLSPLVLEADPAPAHSVSQWSHVRLFSPWRYLIDAEAARLLATTGWRLPDPDALPTGGELVKRYLEPLAAHPALAPRIVYGARVTAVGRKHADKVGTHGREGRPFVVRAAVAGGGERAFEGRAVIDASGTWGQPNPVGAGGYPAPGERENAGLIRYGLPDVLGAERDRYANATVAVAGSGHSAINTVLSLLQLRVEAPATSVVWILRRDDLAPVYGGGANDGLPARGLLGQKAREAIESGAVRLLAPFRVVGIARHGERLEVSGEAGGGVVGQVVVDRLVVATGFRPDLGMLRELRLSTDPGLESVGALAPLIDPNEHSCGTVRPHGARELAQPDTGFYIVGAKSYGRAPTFLLATGYEQVRSVAAELAGDYEAASRVRLDLPETGACGGSRQDLAGAASVEPGCCGGAPVADSGACCKLDEDSKAAGASGCGCQEPAPRAELDLACCVG